MSWDIASDYNYTSSHDLKLWAWEFIRRTDAYKEFWEAGLKNVVRLHENSFRYDYNNGKRHGEIHFENSRGVNIGDLDFYYPAIDRNQWFLETICNPDNPTPSCLSFDIPETLQFNPYDDGKIFALNPFKDLIHSLGKHHAVLWIDLEQPINHQLKQAEIALKFISTKLEDEGIKLPTNACSLTPTRIQQWVLYLRTLDWSCESGDVNEAVDKLFNNITPSNDDPKRKLNETLKQAKEFKRRHYKSLIQSTKTEPHEICSVIADLRW